MKFGRKLQAIYFACIGFIQVVTGFDITINGSQPYYVVGRPFMFTCTFDSTAVAVRILQKNNVKVQSVQLSGADCYNVQIAPAVICDPTFCSCSQQGNTFTASWNFTVSDTQTNTWKCVEGSSQSPDFPVKPAVSCNTVTLTKEQDISYVGQDIKLSCVTDGCRPRAHIQWYIGNKNSTENATATVTTTNSTEELVRVESKLTLTAAIDLNEQTVSCVAWNFDPSVYVMANGTLNVTKGSGNGVWLSGGVIAGIVIAVVVIVCGVAVCVIYIIIKKKKDKAIQNNSENKKPKGRKSSTVGPIDTPEKKNGNWVKPNSLSVDAAKAGGRYSANSVTSRKDVVVDVQETKTSKGDNSEKSDTPRKLPPIPLNVSVTNDQEEKPKKKKKKKEAKQEQKQQQKQERKDNTAFDNDQTENIPSDDTGNPKTKTTPSNNDNIPSDDTDIPKTKTTPSNNNYVPSDDLGNPETKTTPSNNDNTPSDDTGNPEIKTTPINIDSIPSDDLANLETYTSSNNHNIPSDDSGNPETTTPSKIDS